jgi:aminopeptidase
MADSRYRKFQEWFASWFLEVLGAEDPAAHMGLEAAQMQSLAAADRPFSDLRLARPWVITLYPTPAAAEMEGMDLEEYTRFIVGASTTDPAPLRRAEEAIAPLFDRGQRVRIETEHPREERTLVLEMGIEEIRNLEEYVV